MARDCGTEAGDSATNGSTARRRSFLKLVGSAAVATAGAPAVSGVVAGKAGKDYETISIPANEERVFEVGSGETFENKLIDISEPNADARIVANGSDWTVRNVGFKGAADRAGSDPMGHAPVGFPNLIAATGTGTIEHVYLGDGVAGDMIRKGAIGVSSSHTGHIDVTEVTMNGWTGNAVYAGGVADGGGGTMAFDRCLLRNNNISHLRVAADGTTVKNTVIYNTGEVPTHPIQGGVVNSRGVYDGYGTSSDVVEFENCHIDCTDSNTNGAASALVASKTTFRVRNSQVRGRLDGNVETTNVGENPTHEPPKGAPTTAEEAASGTSSAGRGGNKRTRSGSSGNGSASAAATSSGKGTNAVPASGSGSGYYFDFADLWKLFARYL